MKRSDGDMKEASPWTPAPTSHWSAHWSSLLVIVVFLIAQVWVFTATAGLGRTLLLAISIVAEYGLLLWREQVDTLRGG